MLLKHQSVLRVMAGRGDFQMATVVLRTGESQESLLKRFRKEVMKERILPTVRKRWFTAERVAAFEEAKGDP